MLRKVCTAWRSALQANVSMNCTATHVPWQQWAPFEVCASRNGNWIGPFLELPLLPQIQEPGLLFWGAVLVSCKMPSWWEKQWVSSKVNSFCFFSPPSHPGSGTSSQKLQLLCLQHLNRNLVLLVGKHGRKGGLQAAFFLLCAELGPCLAAAGKQNPGF